MKLNQMLFIGAIAIGTVTFTSCSETPAPPAVVDNTPAVLKGESTLNVDLAASKLNWKGDMLGLYSHEGLINLTAGTVNVKDGKIAGGSFTVDMASINPTDNGYDDADHSKTNFIGHLSSNDFFDVANNPTATFAINSVDGATGTGTLTLRGISNQEKIENITVTPEGDNAVRITGTVVFDRKKYNVSFDMPVKDKVLSNDITMKVDILAKK